MEKKVKIINLKKNRNPGSISKSRISADHDASSPQPALRHYQHMIGNQAVLRLMKSGAIQAKLQIGSAGDKYEQEADRTAQSLLRAEQRGFLRRNVDEEEDAMVQTRRSNVGSLSPAAPGIQRDLARRPPGRAGAYVPLTAVEVQDAIAFNNGRFSTRSIRRIQDIVGAPVTGIMDADSIHMICEWQADFRLTVDGKIGRYTLRPIVQELIAEGQRNGAIWLIIDGHNMSTRGLTSIRYDSTVAANASTSGPIPGNSTVRIGPSGFSQGYAGLVHTIAHELEHVRQRRAGILNQNIREFLAEAVEITSRGMILESIGGMMDDARRALHHWNLIPAVDQATHWARFEQVRNEVRRRFNAASAATQATHQATMDAYNAVAAPP
jgi:hypothetical protein